MKKQTVSLLVLLLAASGFFFSCGNTVNKNAYALEFDSIQVNETVHLFGDTAKPACNLILNVAYASQSSDVRLKDSLNAFFLSACFGDKYMAMTPEEAVKKYTEKYVGDYRNDLEPMYKKDEEDKQDEQSIGAWYSYYKGIESHVQLCNTLMLTYRIDYNEYTGGAHGIGFSIAEGMAKCGATVCFNCSNEGSLEKGLAAYKAAGIDAHGYVADVTDEAAVNAMIAQIKADVGPVDILVNNAGLMKRVPMIEMSHTDFLRVIDVHVGGAFNCSKAVLPDMIAKREGKIINICSMMSELGRETVSAYAAAKGALKMLTRNIASEYGEYNIQCNGMGPGYIATAQTAPLREIQPDGSRHPFDTFICAKTPAGRWGTPEDMVGPCVFLASHASDFVNGQILYADGGILAYIGKQPK